MNVIKELTPEREKEIRENIPINCYEEELFEEIYRLRNDKFRLQRQLAVTVKALKHYKTSAPVASMALEEIKEIDLEEQND